MWSPRQLAELAGTSRRTVRHYQEVGLLREPARQSNGYQRYGVDDLIRLLRIRRLTSLGLTLTQVAAIGDDDRPPPEMLRALDHQLDLSIERMQHARTELAAMLECAAPPDLPVAVSHQIGDLPSAERALVVVFSRLMAPDSLEAYLAMVHPYRSHVAAVALENLPADAGESARVAVATALSDHMNRLHEEHTDRLELIDQDLFVGANPRRRVVHQALHEVYNVAQTDALARAVRLRGRIVPRLVDR